MRIRKHAKISPLVYAASSLNPGTLLQTHVCQLNQSPWDVINFSPPPSPPPHPPPPPTQVDGDCVSAGNGSLNRCVSAVQSKEQWEYSDEEPPQSAENESEIILCCKTDGKSWQCRNEASTGNSLCNHHLTQVKSYNNSSSHHAAAAKKPEARRARPRKTQAASSNPYEFYYYSGFGPRWGKKRGESGKNSSTDNGGSNYMIMNGNDEHEDEIERLMSSDDEYEDDDDDDRDNGKKRVRKPIKARSLKSLM